MSFSESANHSANQNQVSANRRIEFSELTYHHTTTTMNDDNDDDNNDDDNNDDDALHLH